MCPEMSSFSTAAEAGFVREDCVQYVDKSVAEIFMSRCLAPLSSREKKMIVIAGGCQEPGLTAISYGTVLDANPFSEFIWRGICASPPKLKK
jgi:hypothetical protein